MASVCLGLRTTNAAKRSFPRSILRRASYLGAREIGGGDHLKELVGAPLPHPPRLAASGNRALRASSLWSQTGFCAERSTSARREARGSGGGAPAMTRSFYLVSITYTMQRWHKWLAVVTDRAFLLRCRT
jgi:hypothetical protein